MGWFLPTPPPVPDVPDATAQQWEEAAPTIGDRPMLTIGGGSVVMQRTGPGDFPTSRDAWMNPDIFVVGREGVEDGRGLFMQIPIEPPEGHGGWDTQFNVGPKIDHSTRTLALFASDWNGIVQQQQMRGEHVVIQRVPPGSTQGYMPTGMEQLNNERDVPPPWDGSLAAQ